MSDLFYIIILVLFLIYHIAVKFKLKYKSWCEGFDEASEHHRKILSLEADWFGEDPATKQLLKDLAHYSSRDMMMVRDSWRRNRCLPNTDMSRNPPFPVRTDGRLSQETERGGKWYGVTHAP